MLELGRTYLVPMAHYSTALERRTYREHCDPQEFLESVSRVTDIFGEHVNDLSVGGYRVKNYLHVSIWSSLGVETIRDLFEWISVEGYDRAARLLRNHGICSSGTNLIRPVLNTWELLQEGRTINLSLEVELPFPASLQDRLTIARALDDRLPALWMEALSEKERDLLVNKVAVLEELEEQVRQKGKFLKEELSK